MIAHGDGHDGATWDLDLDGDATELFTMVKVTLANGRTPWGSGCGGPAIYPGRRINVCTGSSDTGPNTFIARVAPDVRAVVVKLSDGTREDLTLHGDPDQIGARVAVLVYQRDLDIHRIDLLAIDGTILPEQT